MNMVITALRSGAKTAMDIRNWLATNTFNGLAMKYKSDGKGNMGHDATIVCYDGTTKTPKITKKYLNVDGTFN
jgi:branched-chain amino acid transport system substrate-binding protein